jgi:hypothetical protein
MMLVIEWAKQQEVCDMFRGQGCRGCPYYVKDSPCAKKSTTWVLSRASKVFQEYFDMANIVVNSTETEVGFDEGDGNMKNTILDLDKEKSTSYGARLTMELHDYICKWLTKHFHEIDYVNADIRITLQNDDMIHVETKGKKAIADIVHVRFVE